MKITATDRYLSPLLKSLSDNIETEQQSDNASASLGMINGALNNNMTLLG